MLIGTSIQPRVWQWTKDAQLASSTIRSSLGASNNGTGPVLLYDGQPVASERTKCSTVERNLTSKEMLDPHFALSKWCGSAHPIKASSPVE
jgi:hypothetical protein